MESYGQPRKTFADTIGVRYVRIGLAVLWLASLLFAISVFISGSRNITAAVAISLALSVVFLIVRFFEQRSVEWAMYIVIFLSPLPLLVLYGGHVAGILILFGTFGFLLVVILWLMNSSFTYRRMLSKEIQEKRRIESMWGFIRSGIPNDVIKGMTKKRKRMFTVASFVVNTAPLSGAAVFGILLASFPRGTMTDFFLTGNVAYLFAAIYLPLMLVAPSWSIVSSVLAAELVEKQTLEGELNAARVAQASLLPVSEPLIPGFDVSGLCRPASDVGGDFYDYVWLDKRKTKLGIVVADVSGKAMKAAMTAVMTSGMLYSETHKSERPREILRNINHPLYLRSDRRVFTAMGFAVIDTKRRTMTYSCAGQPPPIRVRNGRSDELPVKGVRLPLGVQSALGYQDRTVTLRSKDVLVFITDGVVEAMNEKKEMFGFERLARTLERWHDLPAAAIRDRLLSEIDAFVRDSPQHDDMTIVVAKIL